MRVLQLSDPHLLADPRGRLQGHAPLQRLRHALDETHRQLQASGELPDQLLISGDLCHDETWGGYVRLAEALAHSPYGTLPPPWLLAGNHDHALRLRAALGRTAVLAPALVELGGWQVLLLDSQVPGRVGGELGVSQRRWIAAQLQADGRPLLVAVHHPPLAIGDAGFDAIGLADGRHLLTLLAGSRRWRGLVFGHVHQHWQGHHPLIGPSPTEASSPDGKEPQPGAPTGPQGASSAPDSSPGDRGARGRNGSGGPGDSAAGGAWLLGCPSCFCAYGPVQPCPLGRGQDPGARLLTLMPSGEIRQRLLRWSFPESP